MSILQSTISADIAGKRRLGLIFICFHQFEIRPDGGQKEFLQLRTVEQFPGRAVQATQLGYEFRIWKIKNRRIRIRNLRRTTAGKEERDRNRLTSTAKFTRQFKADDRAHAVPQNANAGGISGIMASAKAVISGLYCLNGGSPMRVARPGKHASESAACGVK